jgi:hypothetical protein
VLSVFTLVGEGSLTADDAFFRGWRQEQLLKKELLARREAGSFLSSVQQDATAKAEQYVADAHARLENRRSWVDKAELRCEAEKVALQTRREQVEEEVKGMHDSEHAAVLLSSLSQVSPPPSVPPRCAAVEVLAGLCRVRHAWR